MIKFTYYGEIRGKGRPRFRNTGKFIQTYTDKETQNYEMSLKEAYLSSGCESYMNPDTPLRLDMFIYHQIPKSVSKKKRQEMLQCKIRPTKKPDIDNILKSVCDSLNKVAFYDDTQIIEVIAAKFYSETPRLEICISEMEGTKR